MNKLRPEFISQTAELRNYLFSYSKPKTMLNKEVSGSVLAGLAEQYVTAINGGAVPNIESAWTYVCSAQKEKLRKELLIEFENKIEEEIENKLPLEKESLDEILKEIKKDLKIKFEKNCLNKITKDEKEEFKKELQKIEGEIKEQNQKLLEDVVEKHLFEEFENSVKEELNKFNKNKPKMISSSNYLENDDNEKNQKWLEEEIKSWKILEKNFNEFINSNKHNFTNKKDLFYKFLYK